MMFRKAQAAMEFLMTYGWAILVVLVVIGALAYFGVLSPSTLLPEKCTFPVSVNCVDHRVTQSSVEVVLLNGAGRDIQVSRISASSEALGTGSLGVGCSTGAITTTLRNGARASFIMNTGDVASACNFKDTGRDKNRYNITIHYSWLDSQSITHTLPGELLSRVS